jgi:hypothetical protein
MSDLFGTPSCAADLTPAAAHVTDETGAAWLCRHHLLGYLVRQLAVGRTIAAYLREGL